MRRKAPRNSWLIAALLLVLAACSSGGDAAADAGGSADGAGEMLCGFVVTAADGETQRHLVDGDEVELLKGVQGYLLVQTTAHLWGSVPRMVEVKVTGAKDNAPGMDSTTPPRALTFAVDGHRATDPLEVWLAPPIPAEFLNQPGTLTLQVQGGGRSCKTAVRVTFVDKTFCVHHDDGSISCP